MILSRTRALSQSLRTTISLPSQRRIWKVLMSLTRSKINLCRPIPFMMPKSKRTKLMMPLNGSLSYLCSKLLRLGRLSSSKTSSNLTNSGTSSRPARESRRPGSSGSSSSRKWVMPTLLTLLQTQTEAGPLFELVVIETSRHEDSRPPDKKHSHITWIKIYCLLLTINKFTSRSYL